MTALEGGDATVRPRFISRDGVLIAGLGLAYLALVCISLAVVAGDVSPVYHIAFDPAHLAPAALSVAAMGCLLSLFLIARFSFGYLASFYMLSVVTGYIWLSFFTPLRYDASLARWSAALSLIAFILPALLLTKATLPRFTLTPRQVDYLVYGLMALAAATAAYASSFEFHLIGFIEGLPFRSQLSYPTWLNYPIGASAVALIPFCYAWTIHRQRYYVAALSLIIGVALYPATLNKVTLFTPLWLISLTVLSMFFTIRLSVILSLLIPLTLGLLAQRIDPSPPNVLFRLINFRMIAIPSSGLDHYNHYFSEHSLTHFCQIRIVGHLFDCALSTPIPITFANYYGNGNFNASLFATEGAASVGPYLAPVTAFVCGLVVAIANKASAGVDDKIIFHSGSILAQALMNVPLSIAMLTNGGALLFILWLVTPRGRTLNRTPEGGTS